jgi:hypothetical protein
MSPTLSFFAPHAALDDAEDPPRDTGEIHCTLSWQEESHHILLTGIINIYFFLSKAWPLPETIQDHIKDRLDTSADSKPLSRRLR